MELQIRPAVAADHRKVADLTIIAGGGIIEALLRDLAPQVSPLEMLSALLFTENPTYSWQNTVVAEVDDKIAGMALAYPAVSSITLAAAPQLPADRLELMQPFEELRLTESFYLCAIAVYPLFRRCDVGKTLLENVVARAVRQRYRSLSLHVFEQNSHAVKFYRHSGFEAVDSRPCISHPGLRYSGNIILMVKSI